VVRIQLHGRFVVVVEGRSVEHLLPGRRGRALVAYLACRRRAVDRCVLADALCSSGSGLTALLSKVRPTLAPIEIVGRQSVQLVLPEGGLIDSAVAAEAAHRADAAAARRDWPEAWTHALSTLFVTQRPFLPDLHEPWVGEHREEVGRLHRRALTCYAEACLALATPTELASAERSARELVRAEPLDEKGHRLLMRALEGRGDRAEALRVYERLRRMLLDELGVGPGPETRALHAEILR
jgi:DNA-binding SARP family transcriptional activator